MWACLKAMYAFEKIYQVLEQSMKNQKFKGNLTVLMYPRNRYIDQNNQIYETV